MDKRRFALVLMGIALMLPSLSTAQQWTDVTSKFILNPSFDDASAWTYETNTGTAGVGSGNMRFYGGWFDCHQRLAKKLPKGTYRLSVQAFYRDGEQGESYAAYLAGTESLDANLYVGDVSLPLVSIYSEYLTYNASGRSWSNDDEHWYPSGRDAAGVAFEEGLYWNTLEFEGEGVTTIGIRCEVSKGANYCVMDNFRLEFLGELPDTLEDPDAPDPSDDDPIPDIAPDEWIDITSELITNPSFDDNTTRGWQYQNGASSQNTRAGCSEFWQGTFDIWQNLTGLPQGIYRLSVQSYYRMGDNESSYSNYLNGTEEITGVLYAGSKTQTLQSPYSYELPEEVSGCWTYNSGSLWQPEYHYFPNTMETAAVGFAAGAYWNHLELRAGGNLRIGIKNDVWRSNNWCIFDNFKLEFYGDLVRATSLTLNVGNTDLLIGEQVQVTATLLPSDVFVKRLVWKSSNESVATVDQQGLVTAQGQGTAVITAKTADGTDISATVTIKVTKNVPTAESLVINEIMASNVDEFISPSINFDGWMELYNPTDKAVTLAGSFVSDDAGNLLRWQLPREVGILPAKGYAVVWFDNNNLASQNAPFILDVDGGTIYVSDENGTLLTQQSYPASLERVSYARTTDGGATWGLSVQATPGASNATSAFATQQLEAPVVNQPSQLFTGTVAVRVTIPQGCTLRYTTDGTLPTMENGQTSQSGSFSVSSTSNYRFRLFKSGMLPSAVTSRSYIYRDRDYMLPVVSVITDPSFLYSSEIGVMTKGPNGRPGNGQSENCNWNMDWERPVNFSYIDADGQMVLNQDVNLEMCGGWSRAWTPHSFKLKGNKELGGSKVLPYQFFSQKPYIRNRTLQIRNGGNDNGCRFKDPALQYILETSGMDVDCQGYQPVHEFINGQYIGVLNVREPNNKHFVDANYGWDDTEIDQFEMSPDSGYVQMCGTADAFIHLVDDLSPNAADADTWKEIEQLLDIEEYTNYMAVQMYLGGTDWPQNNVKGFRHRNGGKFRFVLFDIDFAFNTNYPFDEFSNKNYYVFNDLYPRELGHIEGEIRFVTLFKNLLKNDQFRKRFIDAFCLVGGSVYEASRSAAILDELYERVQPAMQLNWESASSTYNDVRSKLNNRLSIALNALQNYDLMQLSGVRKQQVQLSSNIDGARLQVNGQDVPTGTFNGTLFTPIVLTATAPEGYVFKGWANDRNTIVSTSAEYDISGKGSLNLTATYEPVDNDEALLTALAMPIKVNEVSAGNTIYVNELFKREDWIELYNTTDTPLNVAGLYLSDDASNPMKYQIPASSGVVNTIIPAKGHLLVWADKVTAQSQVHAGFKLSNTNGQAVLVSSSDEFVANNADYFAQHPGLKGFVDGMAYTVHQGEQSVGRYPDGGATFYKMNHPTIERQNLHRTDDVEVGQDKSWMVEQNEPFTLDLAQGWNWISHTLASPIGRSELSDQVQTIQSATAEAYLDTRLGLTGNLKTLEAGQLYKVQMKQADTFSRKDINCQPNMPISLKPGWNWIGYTASGAQDLAHALISLAAEEGDIIIGQDGMAVYTSQKGWTGSVTSVETGKGYMYKSKSAKTLRFSEPAVQVRVSQSRVRKAQQPAWGVDKHAHPSIMGVFAQLTLQGQPVAADRFQLLAVSDGERRGAGQWVDDRVLMNVFGDGGEPIAYQAVDLLDGAVYAVNETSTFHADVEGTYAAPRQLTLGNVIGDSQSIDSPFARSHDGAGKTVTGYYSLSGVLMSTRTASLRPGIYVVRYDDHSFRKVTIR